MSARATHATTLVILVVAAFVIGVVVGVNIERSGEKPAQPVAKENGENPDKNQTNPAEPDKPTEYAEAPAFTIENMKGETVQIKDFTGSNFVLLITTTSCPICREQIDELKKIYKQYADKGVRFANAIIAETDEFGEREVYEADVENYIEETGIPFAVYADNEDTIADDYKVNAVPLLSFITKEGRLMLSREFTYAKDVSMIIDALIAGRPIDTTDMPTKVG